MHLHAMRWSGAHDVEHARYIDQISCLHPPAKQGNHSKESIRSRYMLCDDIRYGLKVPRRAFTRAAGSCGYT